MRTAILCLVFTVLFCHRFGVGHVRADDDRERGLSVEASLSLRQLAFAYRQAYQKVGRDRGGYGPVQDAWKGSCYLFGAADGARRELKKDNWALKLYSYFSPLGFLMRMPSAIRGSAAAVNDIRDNQSPTRASWGSSRDHALFAQRILEAVPQKDWQIHYKRTVRLHWVEIEHVASRQCYTFDGWSYQKPRMYCGAHSDSVKKSNKLLLATFTPALWPATLPARAVLRNEGFIRLNVLNELADDYARLQAYVQLQNQQLQANWQNQSQCGTWQPTPPYDLGYKGLFEAND